MRQCLSICAHEFVTRIGPCALRLTRAVTNSTADFGTTRPVVVMTNCSCNSSIDESQLSRDIVASHRRHASGFLCGIFVGIPFGVTLIVLNTGR